MHDAVIWSIQLQNAVVARQLPPKAAQTAAFARSQLTEWHDVLVEDSSSSRAEFERYLQHYRKSATELFPMPSEMNATTQKLVNELMNARPSGSGKFLANQSFGIWNLIHPHILHNTSFNQTSLLQQEDTIITKPTSTILEEPELFPAKIVRRRFGNASMWQRLVDIALEKYSEYDMEYKAKMLMEGGNYSVVDMAAKFFAWQRARNQSPDSSWPELDSAQEFIDLKDEMHAICVDHMQSFLPNSTHEFVASFTRVSTYALISDPEYGLGFHDHPLSAVVGTFYAQVHQAPILFGDPRGHHPYHKGIKKYGLIPDFGTKKWVPKPPFHKVVPVHVQNGDMVIFPPWLMHAIKESDSGRLRVVFPFDCTIALPAERSWSRTDGLMITAGALRDDVPSSIVDSLHSVLRLDTNVTNTSGEECFHGKLFTKHRCCRIQDPRCFADASEFTFASCCPQQQSRFEQHEKNARVHGNRKGVGTMEIDDNYRFHFDNARGNVNTLLNSDLHQHMDLFALSEKLWETVNSLSAVVQVDHTNLLAWQDAGKTVIELAVASAERPGFGFEGDASLPYYGLSMLENGCLTPSDMQDAQVWSIQLQNTILARHMSPRSAEIAKLVQSQLSTWHERLLEDAANTTSDRAVLERYLLDFRTKNTAKFPLPSELPANMSALITNLMQARPSAEEPFSFWNLIHPDVFVHKNSTTVGSLNEDKLTPKPKSTFVDETNLFASRIMRRRFGNPDMWQRLTNLVLERFSDFDADYIQHLIDSGQDLSKYSTGEVNGRFYEWQKARNQTDSHKWPELDADPGFQALKVELQATCAEYIQSFLPEDQREFVGASVKMQTFASVQDPGLGLIFHDHPMSVVGGTFYVQVPHAPIMFADPRGHPPFRMETNGKKWAPIAPFHKVGENLNKTLLQTFRDVARRSPFPHIF